jgi:hypothetical protein
VALGVCPAAQAALPDVHAAPSSTFTISDVHYAFNSTGDLSFGLTTVTFRLTPSASHDVTAWFNTDSPRPGRVYSCMESRSTWSCKAPSVDGEQDVRTATSLRIRVDGTDVLGEKVTRHHHEPPSSTANAGQRSSGALPFTGSNIATELLAALLLMLGGGLLLTIGRRRDPRQRLR